MKSPSLSAGSQPLCVRRSGQSQEWRSGSYASPSTTGTLGFSASQGIWENQIDDVESLELILRLK